MSTLSGGRLPRLVESPWKGITVYSDTNTGNIFDLDTNVLPTTYDMYRIFGNIQNQNGSGNNIIYCRVNNISSSNYVTAYWDGDLASRITYFTDAQWYLLDVDNGRDTFIDYIIRGKNETAPPNQYPIITGVGNSGVATRLTMLNGNLTVSTATVNRIRVYSSGVATGRLAIFGMNFDDIVV